MRQFQSSEFSQKGRQRQHHAVVCRLSLTLKIRNKFFRPLFFALCRCFLRTEPLGSNFFMTCDRPKRVLKSLQKFSRGSVFEKYFENLGQNRVPQFGRNSGFAQSSRVNRQPTHNGPPPPRGSSPPSSGVGGWWVHAPRATVSERHILWRIFASERRIVGERYARRCCNVDTNRISIHICIGAGRRSVVVVGTYGALQDVLFVD